MKNISRIIRIGIIVIALGVLAYLVVPDMALGNEKGSAQTDEITAETQIELEGEDAIVANPETAESETEAGAESESEAEAETTDQNVEVETLGRPAALQMQFSMDDTVVFKIFEDDIRILRSDAYKYYDGSINSDAVWEFVSEIADRYWYTSTSGEEIKDPSTGTLMMGKYIATNATYQELVSALNKSGQSTAYAQWYYEPFVGNGVGTYIEINITEQHLWYFKNSVLIVDTDVVTGLNDAEHATPTGTFKILNKNTNTRLQGTMGDDTWDEFVNYWMGVTNTGIGIHDAPWRDYYGGSIYQYGGSHGCINVPYSNMKTLFDNVSVGTTVLITY